MNERYYPYETETGICQLISVTSVLAVADKPGLNIWRAKQGFELSEQYSQETADIGKEIHNFVSRLLQGTPISKLEWEQLDDQIKNGIRAFERFRVATGLVMADCEKVVYNLKYKFAGTLDCVGKIGNKYVIIDWKTNDKLYPANYAQITAYYKALKEMMPQLKIKELLVVNLPRTTGIPKINSLKIKDARSFWEYFLCCLNLFNKTKEIEDICHN